MRTDRSKVNGTLTGFFEMPGGKRKCSRCGLLLEDIGLDGRCTVCRMGE